MALHSCRFKLSSIVWRSHLGNYLGTLKYIREPSTSCGTTEFAVGVQFWSKPHPYSNDFLGFGGLKIPHTKPHDTLVDYLQKELGPFIAPPNLTWNAKLQDFWKINKTVILAYNNEKVLKKYSHLLWPPVYQRWGNCQEPDKLKAYMKNVFEK